MPIIHHRAPLQCLVAVRGHPFDRTAFDALFQAMDGISATMVDQPAAASLMNPEGMRGFDVLVLYDMPGLDFEAGEGAPAYLEPPQDLSLGMRALFEAGKGVVALHHALAGWPTWPEYHEWMGGQFLYHHGKVRGAPVPDSGYAHEVTYEAEVLADHPVTAGLPQRPIWRKSSSTTSSLCCARTYRSRATGSIRPILRCRGRCMRARGGNTRPEATSSAGRVRW